MWATQVLSFKVTQGHQNDMVLSGTYGFPLLINLKKTYQFKTWCKGDKSNIDHFCEDTRQNALAVRTNLGHVTPFLLLGHLIIPKILRGCQNFEIGKW